ncbi:hypothetical protein [Viscerimonas tarda]
MRGNTFLILIIILLLVINAFIFVRFYQYKKQAPTGDAISYDQESNEEDELHSYKVNFTTNILNSNFQLDSIMIKDPLNNIIPMKEAFGCEQKQMLVCRFSELYCESCVDFALQLFRHWTDSIGVENVLFLGAYRNNRIFNRTKPLYGIQNMNVYNVSELNIPVEERGYPYYFILNYDLTISNVFIPDKATPSITNNYLKMINKRYFAKTPPK